MVVSSDYNNNGLHGGGPTIGKKLTLEPRMSSSATTPFTDPREGHVVAPGICPSTVFGRQTRCGATAVAISQIDPTSYGSIAGWMYFVHSVYSLMIFRPFTHPKSCREQPPRVRSAVPVFPTRTIHSELILLWFTIEYIGEMRYVEFAADAMIS